MVYRLWTSLSRNICTVPAYPGKQHFCYEYHQQTNGRGTQYFADKINEVPKL